MGIDGENQERPLLRSFHSADGSDQLHSKRSGNVWTAMAHIITGVIGAGVLSLAWSTGQLGWVAGPLAMVVFAACTLISTFFLSQCYKSPDPEHGPIINSSFMQAVKFYLGGNAQLLCGIIWHESLYGAGVAYTITVADSVRSLLLLDLPVVKNILFSDPLLPPLFCFYTFPQSLSSLEFIDMVAPHSLELENHSSNDEGSAITRTGTVWTATAHIITAVIGAGVLSLAWSTSQLGWIAGPVSMLCFAVMTYVSASLISDCYRTPVTGTRNRCYIDAVTVNLGRKRARLCGLLQYLNFYGTCIAYVFTTSASLRAIQQSNCYHKEGHEAACEYGDTIYMLIFGVVQIVMSQIPDFHNMAWLSVVAAIMSFSYASIGLGLGFAKVIENREVKGSIRGIPADNLAQKLYLVFQGLGDIAFAYPYSIILLEIQDTLKSPPPENQTIKKASVAAVCITTFFYLSCGCFGYAAFGNNTPGNLLTGFGFYEPYWLVDFANACIVLHLIGGYQIFSQPIFAFVERWLAEKFPNSGFVYNFYTFKLPFFSALRLNPMRLCFRTVYVISTTGIAVVFPYFNQVLGVLGALNFWPLAVYFPVEMYIVQTKIGAWTRKWLMLQTFSMVCLLVSIVALVGSVEGLIKAKFS